MNDYGNSYTWEPHVDLSLAEYVALLEEADDATLTKGYPIYHRSR